MSAEYEVVIPGTGRVILTTPHLNRAKAFAKHRAKDFGKLIVEEVQRIEQRRRVWTANLTVSA